MLSTGLHFASESTPGSGLACRAELGTGAKPNSGKADDYAQGLAQTQIADAGASRG